jgi:hypothetical protein
MEPSSHANKGGVRVLSDIQQKNIMRACDNRCECCGQQYSRYILEIRGIGESETRPHPVRRINEGDVVVICARCWHATKGMTGHDALLRSIVRERPKEVKIRIQEILDHKSAPYMPETDFDLAELFAEAYDPNAMDLFLNGM